MDNHASRPKKNRFKYKCDECGWTGFFSIQEFARRSRPRCGGCGSTWLELTHNAAKARVLEHDHQAREQKDRMGLRMGLT